MRVVVVGMAYTVVTLAVDDFPVTYRPVSDAPISSSVAGSGFTAARTLAALGDEVFLAAPLGEDAEAAAVDAAAYRYRVNSAMCSRSLPRSPRAVVLEDGNGQRRISRDLGEARSAHVELDLGALATAELLLVDPVLPTTALVSGAQASGVPVAVRLGPVGEPPGLEHQPYLGADLLVMSHRPGMDPRELLHTWRQRSTARLVVLTLGEHGAIGARNGEVVQLPARDLGTGRRPAGLGATYFATLAHCIFALGCDPREAMHYAGTAAAWTIANPGAPDGLGRSDLEAAAARADRVVQTP